jgi:hypothetical protein
MDHERVAALHDGRLGPHERDELLNDLLSNDDEYELFAETAAVLREIEEAHGSASPASSAVDPLDRPAPAADGDDGVIPLTTRRPQSPAGALEVDTAPAAAQDDRVVSLDSRRPGRTRWMAYGALAAGLAGLALAAALLTNRGEGPLDDPREAVALLEDGATRGPRAGWAYELWPPKRGGDSEAGPEDQLAVRLGAYLVDLELAAAPRDTAALGLLSAKVERSLDGVNGSSLAANAYRTISQRPSMQQSEAERLLAQGREFIQARMPAEWLGLGVWIETARTAAVRRDAGFFHSRYSRSALERAEALPGLDEPSRNALAAIRGALPVEGPPKWEALENALGELLREAAR